MDLNISEYIPVKQLTKDDLMDIAKAHVELLVAEAECLYDTEALFHNINEIGLLEHAALLVNITPSTEGLLSPIKSFFKKLMNCASKLLNWINTILQKYQFKQRCLRICEKLKKIKEHVRRSKPSQESAPTTDQNKNATGVNILNIDDNPYADKTVDKVNVSLESVRIRAERMGQILHDLRTMSQAAGRLLNINLKKKDLTIADMDAFIEKAKTEKEQIDQLLKSARKTAVELNDAKLTPPKPSKESPDVIATASDSIIKSIGFVFDEWSSIQDNIATINGKLGRLSTGTVDTYNVVNATSQNGKTKLSELMEYVQPALATMRAVRDAMPTSFATINAIVVVVDAKYKEIVAKA